MFLRRWTVSFVYVLTAVLRASAGHWTFKADWLSEVCNSVQDKCALSYGCLNDAWLGKCLRPQGVYVHENNASPFNTSQLPVLILCNSLLLRAKECWVGRATKAACGTVGSGVHGPLWLESSVYVLPAWQKVCCQCTNGLLVVVEVQWKWAEELLEILLSGQFTGQTTEGLHRYGDKLQGRTIGAIKRD